MLMRYYIDHLQRCLRHRLVHINESLNQVHGAEVGAEHVDESCSKSVKSPSSQKKCIRKRKAEDAMEAMMEAINKMNDDTNNRLQTISKRIGYDFDLSEKRTEVSGMLNGVPFLSKKHKFVACDSTSSWGCPMKISTTT